MSSFLSVSMSMFIFLLCSLICCVFQISHISDIIQYLSFSFQLISLSIIPSKFMHVVANGKTSLCFCGWVVFNTQWNTTHNIYIHTHTHTHTHTYIYMKVKILVSQLCPTLCDPMDYSPPGSSVCGISQGRILEWVVIPFSRVSSRHSGQILYHLSYQGSPCI